MSNTFAKTTDARFTGNGSIPMQYNSSAAAITPEMRKNRFSQRTRTTPPLHQLNTSSSSSATEDLLNAHSSPPSDDKKALDGEEALLDLGQLEELHLEAERIKALGNKHMAAQEYSRAYNAYSAALQLSPVGPSSHVFLSNRAAALLSLKRYSAAATDARRAVVLAPTFGKAHARLGQALYFLKNYTAAVAAYEDAIQFEPGNQVTQTYLEKAKVKLYKQQERAQRAARGDEISIAEESTQFTMINSVATDPSRSAAIIQHGGGFRSKSQVLENAVMISPSSIPNTSPLVEDEHLYEDTHNPDFDEALKIQRRAHKYLANKQYKSAIEEYTAALFLIPDDPNLSPQLHLGRAHALNGSRRHASARNDAQLAIRILPSPEAYSTLAKSLFYLKHYEGALEGFDYCEGCLAEGESLSMFDQAYRSKAEAALKELQESGSVAVSQSSFTTPVPKLKPPRFVPREQAIKSTPNLPPMPKQWPQQSSSSTTSLRCGTERVVVFLSESLGIKLNRGGDGIVRVISVSKETAGSPVARKGQIMLGDIVREAAGVDIRRPITNIMWGDTVALVKMAPRPITFIVARELSQVPAAVMEQRRISQLEDKKAAAGSVTRMRSLEEAKTQIESPYGP